MRHAILLIIFAAALLAYLMACSVEGENAYPTENSFVGSKACQSCHAKEYNLWTGSHHDWAMKLPSDSTVLGDFNDVTFSADGVSYRFYMQDTAFMVSSTDLDGVRRDYPIAYTFGVYPLQQYLVKFPRGQYQTLRASWDSDKNRWFHQYAGTQIATGDWLHWTRGGQRWNTMCAECHSTNLEKNYDPETRVFNTTYSEINVSCESCHGKGAHHVVWALEHPNTEDMRILVNGATQQEQVRQCAACHSRRTKLTETGYPELDYEEQYIIQTINSEFYHPDGQIREEDYVMGSFLQSQMYHQDVKCTDCHDPHSLGLKYVGNALCMQCHEPPYDTPEHHFHPMGTESALCVSCHMTGEVYMGNDFRRDHSFRVPRPDQSLVYGTPNACTGCHTDKSDRWAADQIIEWYGEERPPHFSDVLLKASDEPIDENLRDEIYTFINNVSQPAIARATALQYLPLLGTEREMATYQKALADSGALVRYHALVKLMDLPVQDRIGIALGHLGDTSRMVRMAAARLAVEQDPAALSPQLGEQLSFVLEEYENMLFVNADFPMGRFQMGDYYLRKNRVQEAIVQYEIALEMDSLVVQLYTNLATAYSIDGRNDKAMQTLNKLISLEPGYDFAYYLRGLLNFELGQREAAISDLSTAVGINDQNFRYHYNLANLLYQEGRIREALAVIEKGLVLQPDSQDGLYLLQLIRSGGG